LHDKGVNVAKVDVTQNGGLGKRFDIKGFPTLILLRRGQAFRYACSFLLIIVVFVMQW
jgi:thioredoxin-like negative regulator of GroEL